MDFEHMKVEIIRQVLVRQGVIPDNGPIGPDAPIKTCLFTFKCE